ncbi:hypothetical protein K474DRAFT_1700764 [Panus rudis PR-1116 ss-1]|nr:hypothetical protein K474DRAFT_1700764 [Panus rudis PR-1116 ss-1]
MVAFMQREVDTSDDDFNEDEITGKPEEVPDLDLLAIDTGPEWLWFTDGNVVLVATGGPGDSGHGFCVHSGVLELHSIVFRRWFANDYRPIKAMKILTVSDTWMDVRDFLTSLYLPLNKRERSISEACAVYRMAVKYGATHAREEAIQFLETRFPERLCDFDNIDYDLDDPLLRPNDPKRIRVKKTDAIEVLNLARAYDLDSLLAPAFYVCAQLDERTLSQGALDSHRGVWHKLSAHDRRACKRGKSCLIDSCDEYSLDLRFLRCKQCKSKRQRLLALTFAEDWPTTHACSFEFTCWFDTVKPKLICQNCRYRLAHRWKRHREGIWRSIPDMFGLSDS